MPSEVGMIGDVARTRLVVLRRQPAVDRVENDCGDRDEAVDALFRRHCEDLVGLGFFLLGDRGAAEEVVQDAFLALHRGWAGLRAHTSAVSYLRAAVVNGCRSRQRRLVRARALAGRLKPAVKTVSSLEDTAVVHEELSRLAAAMLTLPTRQREVLVCRFYLEMSVTQTADLLQIGKGSVSTHTRRALAGLARQLEVTP
jgi:RNA polymerase sigma factor (sigma-70 family)